jgi:hypothetical protein
MGSTTPVFTSPADATTATGVAAVAQVLVEHALERREIGRRAASTGTRRRALRPRPRTPQARWTTWWTSLEA